MKKCNCLERESCDNCPCYYECGDNYDDWDYEDTDDYEDKREKEEEELYSLISYICNFLTWS